MADNQDKSLVVHDDESGQPEETSVGSEIGGFQAVILFLAIAVAAWLVFIFPTPNNPSVESPAAGDDDQAAATEAPAPEVNVYFGNLEDGAEVTSPFTVEMVAEGVAVAPSGAAVEGEGHFHILIDTPFYEDGVVVPADDVNKHYGDGSTQATLELEPGEHTLRLQFANGLHEAFGGDDYTDEVTITVLAPEPTEEVTPEPTEEVVATEEATPEPTEEVTPEPTEEATAEPTEEPTEEAAPVESADHAHGEGPILSADAIAAAITAGNAENGQVLFNTMQETASGPWMCAACHSVDENQIRLVGPPLYQVYMHADDHLSQMENPPANAVEYIRQSILNPQAFIVPGDPPYPENLMPQNYEEVFSEEELNDIIAYLLSLGNPDASGAEGEEHQMDMGGMDMGGMDMGMPTEEATEEATAAESDDHGHDAEPTEEAEPVQSAGAGQGLGRMNSAEAISMMLAEGDTANGQAIFNAMHETASGPWMCAACHSVDETELRLVGPGLYGIYARADERIAEMNPAPPNAVAYIRGSILHPQEYVVQADPAYPENLMPQNYGEIFTEQEITDLIAYLLTLGNPDA